MVRSALAVLAILILPAFAGAQQVPATHTVVDGDTLWDLAESFYGDPFDWRRIWEANRGQVEDPNLILPGWVLNIPDGRMADEDMAGEDAAGQEMAEEAMAGEDRAGEDMAEVEVSVEDAAGPAPVTRRGDRTLFYRDASDRARVLSGAELDYLAVPRDVAFSAPWLIRLDEEPEHVAFLADFAGGTQRSETPRSYDRVRLEVDGAQPRVGDVLRTYRVTRVIQGVGQVVQPTGLVNVTDVGDGHVVAVVTQEYDRIGLGDLVGPLPRYGLAEGEYAQEVMNGPRAMVMGFAGFNEVHDIGSIAFLDLGRDQGIVIGDEFEYLNPQAGSNVVEGRLQVVGVQSGIASASPGVCEDSPSPGSSSSRAANRFNADRPSSIGSSFVLPWF